MVRYREATYSRVPHGLLPDSIVELLLEERSSIEQASWERTMPSVPTPFITADPERLGGAPVFAGTRVPVHTLIYYVEAGHPLDQFLDDYPSVTREHAIAVLELAKRALITPAA